MKTTLSLLFLLLVVVVACQADPTVIPTAAPFSPTLVSISTLTPGETVSPTEPSVPGSTATLPAATVVATVPVTRGASGSPLTIAGVGTPSRAVTELPDFVAHALYDSLLRVNPQNGDLIPGLAASWLVSQDAKTFVFTLRDNVKWHDGSPLTAADVVFTLRALSSPDIRLRPAADFGPIANISAPDTRTVNVTFRSPYCAALTYIGRVNILPAHVLSKKSLTDVAPADMIGTGPLVLDSWQNDKLTFQRNTNYWNGAPKVTDWTYRFYPDATTAANAVRDGSADVLATDASLSGVNNLPYTANEFYALALNMARKPFDDARVRRAIVLGLDRSEFTQMVGGVPLTTSLLPTSWAFPPNLTATEFDASAARQMLATAGWRDADGDGIVEQDGKPLEVTLWAQVDEPRSQVSAQLARQQLARIGVRAILKMSDRILFLTRAFLHEYDLALVHFNIPLDPDQHYFWAADEDVPGAGLNVTGYSNARVEAALEAGNSAARCDPLARKNSYLPVWSQIAEDVPMVFLFAPLDAVNTSARVRGPSPASYAGAFWNLNAWEVAP